MHTEVGKAGSQPPVHTTGFDFAKTTRSCMRAHVCVCEYMQVKGVDTKCAQCVQVVFPGVRSVVSFHNLSVMSNVSTLTMGISVTG